MNTELLPCPFCGNTKTFTDETQSPSEMYFTVGCPDSNCPGAWSYVSEDVEEMSLSVEKWNTRTAPTPSATVQERAEAYADRMVKVRYNEASDEAIKQRAIDDYLAGAGDNVSDNQRQAEEIERLKEKNKALTEALELIFELCEDLNGARYQKVCELSKEATFKNKL